MTQTLPMMPPRVLRARAAFGVLVAASIGAICALSASDATALPPPTEIDAPIGGGRPVVRGEKPPEPGKELGKRRVKTAPAPTATDPGDRASKTPTPAAGDPATKKPKPPPVEPKPVAKTKPPVAKPAPTPVVRKPVATVSRRPRRRARRVHAKTILVFLGGGRLSVPRSVVTLASGFDTTPDLVATAVDIAVMRPAAPGHFYGARIGIASPQVPAANWYNADGSGTPLWHNIDLTFIDLAFEYAYRRPIIGPVGLLLRFGIGVNIAAGDVERVEVLPTCSAPAQRCPHWPEVGRHSGMPSPIWPSLRATGGLFANLGDNLGLHVEGGVRDAVYVGAGLSFRQ